MLLPSSPAQVPLPCDDSGLASMPEVRVWEASVSSGLLPMALRPMLDTAQDIFCQGSFRTLAGLRVGELSVAGISAGSRVGLGTPRRGGYAKLLFMTSGRSHMWRDGAACLLDEGTWISYDPAWPYRIDTERNADCLAVALPAALLPEPVRESGALQHHDIDGNMLLALQALRSCVRGDADQGADPTAIGVAILTLLDAGVRRARSGPDARGREEVEDVLRLRADWYIRQHFADSACTVDTVADALQVSRRTLYNVLKQHGQTPHRIIQRYRLDACAAALADAAQNHRSVTEIALDAGFPDAGHFARLFRQYLGMTPSVYRHYMAAALPSVHAVEEASPQAGTR